MSKSEFQSDQIVNNNALPVTRQAAGSDGDALLTAIDQNFDSPLRLFASNPSDAKLNFQAQQFQTADGTGKSVPPLSSTVPTVAASTINFQTQATTGATFALTFPVTDTPGNFVRVGFTMLSSGTIQALFSASAGSVGALANPGTLFVSGGIPLGWIDLQCTTGTTPTAYKTAGSATSIIENQVSGTSRIVNFGSGGSGGSSGSGSGTGDDLDALQFQASFSDLFTESATNANSSINSSGTNASFNVAKSIYALSYDASKTASSSGTTVTMSGAPGFTVAVGDVVVAGTFQRKILTVTSQTSYVVEAAFPTALSSAQVTVSQCVYTKDIYNLAVDGASLASEFGAATFSEIMVDYKDNLTSGSSVFTPGVGPYLAYSGSNDNTNFSNVTARPTLGTTQIQSVILPSAGANLYLRFFVSQSSGSGTANLINYKAFMQKSVSAAGTLNAVWSSYATTNSSTTPINCTLSVVGGKTQVTFVGNTYPVGALAGQTVGSLEVLLNGQKLPRFVSGSVPTTDGYYTEVNGNVIQLDSDYSGLPLDLQVTYSLQVLDSSTPNASAIAAIQAHSFNNRLINGAFDYWQRGTSTTVANAATSYQADRWYAKNSLGTSGVLTYSQAAGVLTGSKFGASLQITTAPTAAQVNGCELYQVIENLNSLELIGQNISFGASVKALGNVTSIGLQFCYATTEVKPTLFFGTEQTVTVNSSGFTPGQLFAQNSGALPTSAGVIGVRIRILGVSSGNTYDLNNGFVVEQGICVLGGFLPNSFFRAGRNTQAELTMCQRYCELVQLSRRPLNKITSSIIQSFILFETRKRVVPSLVTNLSSTFGAGSTQIQPQDGTNATITGTGVSYSTQNPTITSMEIDATGTLSGGTVGNGGYYIASDGHITYADSEI